MTVTAMMSTPLEVRGISAHYGIATFLAVGVAWVVSGVAGAMNVESQICIKWASNAGVGV